MASIKEKIQEIFKTNNLTDETASSLPIPKNICKVMSDCLKVKTGVGKYRYVIVLELSVPKSSSSDFDPLWGVSCIPKDYRNMNVDITLVDCVHPYSDSWVNTHRDTAEAAVTMNHNTQADDGTVTEYEKATVAVNDMIATSNELLAGAVYLDTTHYLILSSDNMKDIKQVQSLLQQDLSKELSIVSASQIPFLQSYLMQSIVRDGITGIPKAKQAHWSMSSMMYGGYYNFLSKSIMDESGEYLGTRFNDISVAPVIFDFDLFEKSMVVVNSSAYKYGNSNIQMSDYISARIEAACLSELHRVVHINLTDRPILTRDTFKSINTIIDERNRINPFEIFGTEETELSDFSAHIDKMLLLFKQLVDSDPTVLSMMTGNLGTLLTEFYVDQGMWHPDARNHRDSLRVIGIPHDTVPTLRDFAPYLEERYKQATKLGDANQVNALNILRMTFNNLLDVNGDIFDTITSDVFDSHISSHMITFDLANLRRRSIGVAMAQLINVFNVACANLSDGDVLIVHGAENIPNDVFEFIHSRLFDLSHSGARHVFVYDRFVDSTAQLIEESDCAIYGKLLPQDIHSLESAYNTAFQSGLTDSLTNMQSNQVYIKRTMAGYVNDALCSIDMSDLPLLAGNNKAKAKTKKERMNHQ